MKFTALDIQRREFASVFRGLNEGEVRGFLHEIASEWEEMQLENQKFRTEVLDLRERLQQYQEQDRIFRETLLNAQRTREDVIADANREKSLILREAQFKADEIVLEAQRHTAEMEAQLRTLKLERVRYLTEVDALLTRSRRFLQEEAPELFPMPGETARKLDEPEASRLDIMPNPPTRARLRPLGA